MDVLRDTSVMQKRQNSSTSKTQLKNGTTAGRPGEAQMGRILLPAGRAVFAFKSPLFLPPKLHFCSKWLYLPLPNRADWPAIWPLLATGGRPTGPGPLGHPFIFLSPNYKGTVYDI
jgi:hypothetical protein